MVERQYDILRRERMKGMEEQKVRPDDANVNSNSSNEPTTANANEDNHPREVVFLNNITAYRSVYLFCV